MKSLFSRRHIAALCAVAALILLCLPALAGAGAPKAGASATCGVVTTLNGGKAEFVSTTKAKCRTGRRVAKRATGKRYSFLGFDCKLMKKGDFPGKLYGCGRVRNGQGQGIGFIYTGP